MDCAAARRVWVSVGCDRSMSCRSDVPDSAYLQRKCYTHATLQAIPRRHAGEEEGNRKGEALHADGARRSTRPTAACGHVTRDAPRPYMLQTCIASRTRRYTH